MTEPFAAPVTPLISTPDGLDRYPSRHAALVDRMAQVYGVRPEQVLPTRGVSHAVELAFRLASRDGLRISAPEGAPYDQIRQLYRTAAADGPTEIVIVAGAPNEDLVDLARSIPDGLLIVDDGAAEFADRSDFGLSVDDVPNLVQLRSLSLAYGLAGARVGAALGSRDALGRLAEVLEPHALPTPSVRLALQALHPSRIAETAQRVEAVRSERRRLTERLSETLSAEAEGGPAIRLPLDQIRPHLASFAVYGVETEILGDHLRLPVFETAELNDRILAALGLSQPRRPERIGRSVRDTLETQIVCTVDLDTPGPVAVKTGVGFYDHMLEQIAAHGGFALRLACEGDLHTDVHHTVEDAAIALGQALREALGDRRGIGRYGFVLPMDEAEAKISIDLSGRPCFVFKGEFSTPYIGAYRTDLTAHVFNSLAENLKAAIHLEVTGADDHHKTEACFKAFGRAMRQAVRREGEAIPSTKGVL